jgi:hypothetical protein
MCTTVCVTHLLEAGKGLGRDILCYRHVPLGRPHVLTKRQHVHICIGRSANLRSA